MKNEGRFVEVSGYVDCGGGFTLDVLGCCQCAT